MPDSGITPTLKGDVDSAPVFVQLTPLSNSGTAEMPDLGITPTLKGDVDSAPVSVSPMSSH